MFSTISMLAKNRTSFKSPVATVEDQLLLWSDWLLVVFASIWLLDNKVENRHFLFMWQHSTQNKWLTWQARVKQMLWNSSNMNSDIPTRLPREDFNNNIISQSYGYHGCHTYHKINFSNYLLRWIYISLIQIYITELVNLEKHKVCRFTAINMNCYLTYEKQYFHLKDD